MQITQSQFFKVQPLNTSNHKLKEKCGFIWVDEPTEEKLSVMIMMLGQKFYDGCKLIPADKSDKEFIAYIEKDLIQVQKDIDKLELLKQRLLEARK